MTVTSDTLRLKTRPGYDIHDITDRVQQSVRASGLSEGVVTVFVPGATGGLTTVEFEPGLVRDLDEFFERVAPTDRVYHHNERWHDGNGHAHVRASLIGPSLTVPFGDGSLQLGTWQQIVFLDFDPPPRDRTLLVKVIGE